MLFQFLAGSAGSGPWLRKERNSSQSGLSRSARNTRSKSNCRPCLGQRGQKTIPYPAARPRIAQIRECPPPPPHSPRSLAYVQPMRDIRMLTVTSPIVMSANQRFIECRPNQRIIFFCGWQKLIIKRLVCKQWISLHLCWKESNVTIMAGDIKAVLYFVIFSSVENSVGEYSFRSKPGAGGGGGTSL